MNQRPTACSAEIFTLRPHLTAVHARPNTARVHDYLLGGKDNFAQDREFAHRVLELAPGFRSALRANRKFVTRATRHLVARRGIRQIIEVGMGYPGRNNVHEVAQQLAPDTRVVYVDHDPVVLSHARALLATDERVRVVEGRLSDPHGFIGHEKTLSLIDFTQPVAVLLPGGLQFVPPHHSPHEMVARMHKALSPGSYLVITRPADSADTRLVSDLYREYLDEPQSALAKEQIAAFFRGLELEPPGLVPVTRWHPGIVSIPESTVWFYAGAGRVTGPRTPSPLPRA